MRHTAIHNLLTGCIALTWFTNGLVCKVLNFAPRHQQIVGRILGVDHSRLFTVAIGCSEILMAIWVISKINTRLNTFVQMVIVAVMNTLEFFLVPDLLLWGKLNAFFAFLFILVVYFNEFYLNKKIVHQA